MPENALLSHGEDDASEGKAELPGPEAGGQAEALAAADAHEEVARYALPQGSEARGETDDACGDSGGIGRPGGHDAHAGYRTARGHANEAIDHPSIASDREEACLASLAAEPRASEAAGGLPGRIEKGEAEIAKADDGLGESRSIRARSVREEKERPLPPSDLGEDASEEGSLRIGGAPRGAGRIVGYEDIIAALEAGRGLREGPRGQAVGHQGGRYPRGKAPLWLKMRIQ